MLYIVYPLQANLDAISYFLINRDTQSHVDIIIIEMYALLCDN